MRRSDLALAAGLSAAFVAGLHLLDAARPARDGVRVTHPRIAAPVAAEQAGLSSRPAPVPLHLKHRPAFGSLTVEGLIEAASVENAAPDLPETVDPDAVAARTAAEADGYRDVKILKRGPDGNWRVSGLRGRTTVLLTVDANGAVSAD